MSKNRLCFSCLTGGHRSKECKDRATCKRCGKSHPSSLHKEAEDWNKEKNSNRKEIESAKQHIPQQNKTASTTDHPTKEISSTEHNERKVNVHHTTRRHSSMLSMILPVHVSCEGQSKEVLTYALLDTQSDACFMTAELARQIRPSYVYQSRSYNSYHERTYHQ